MARIKIKVKRVTKNSYLYGLPDGTILKGNIRKAEFSDHMLWCVKGTMIHRLSDTPKNIDKTIEYTFFEREVVVL